MSSETGTCPDVFQYYIGYIFGIGIRCFVNPSQKRGPVEMGRQVAVVLYPLAMAALIVGVDVVFFQHRFWERLSVNVGIVLVFIAFYFRFFRHS